MVESIFHVDDLVVPLTFITNGRKAMRKTIDLSSLYSRLSGNSIIECINLEHGIKHNRERILQLLKGVKLLGKLRFKNLDLITLVGVASFEGGGDLVFYYRYLECEEELEIDITSIADKQSDFFNRFVFGTLEEMKWLMQNDGLSTQEDLIQLTKLINSYLSKGINCIKERNKKSDSASLLSEVFSSLNISTNPLD